MLRPSLARLQLQNICHRHGAVRQFLAPAIPCGIATHRSIAPRAASIHTLDYPSAQTVAARTLLVAQALLPVHCCRCTLACAAAFHAPPQVGSYSDVANPPISNHLTQADAVCNLWQTGGLHGMVFALQGGCRSEQARRQSPRGCFSANNILPAKKR